MIAVIGATGFTGRRVIDCLRSQIPDQQLVAIVRASGRREDLPADAVAIRTAELDDLRSLQSAFLGVQLAVCCVSLGFGHAPNLVAALQAVNPDHVILFSTMSIYS